MRSIIIAENSATKNAIKLIQIRNETRPKHFIDGITKIWKCDSVKDALKNEVVFKTVDLAEIKAQNKHTLSHFNFVWYMAGIIRPVIIVSQKSNQRVRQF